VAGVMLVGLAGYGAGLAAQQAGDAKGAQTPDAGKSRPTADAGVPSATKHEPPAPDGSAPRPTVGAGAPRPIIVYSNVPAEAEIVRILPDGSLVKKGDFICGLHSADADAQLANLHNTIKAAQAAHTSARLDREVAEIAVREYVEGDYVDQLAEAEGDIKIAEAELTLAEDGLKSFKQAGFHPDQREIRRAEIQVLRARFALEKAQSRKKLLIQYTRDRKVKQLAAAVKKAQADEQARQATWEYKVGEAKRLADSCTIVAPIDGRLRYDRDGPYPTEVGIRVAPGRLLFTIEPLDRSAPPEKDAPANAGGPVPR
jgi:multidrug efflux pump subunit AcrA (membrane-fusion protein)